MLECNYWRFSLTSSFYDEEAGTDEPADYRCGDVLQRRISLVILPIGNNFRGQFNIDS